MMMKMTNYQMKWIKNKVQIIIQISNCNILVSIKNYNLVAFQYKLFKTFIEKLIEAINLGLSQQEILLNY
jgi:hypothetical protein